MKSYKRPALTVMSLALIASAAFSQQGPEPQLQQPPQSDVKTTLVPLPQGPPPTGPSGPNPRPAAHIPPADQPLLSSPSLDQIKGFAATHTLSIDDALAIALYTNRSLATAIANLQAAEARTGVARAALNPTLGVNSQLTYWAKAVTFNIGELLPPALLPPGSSAVFVVVPQFNPVNTAAFTLPIDLSGTIRSAVSQAKFNEVAARIDVNRVRNQLIADVKTAFYNVLRAQAQMGVATENVNVSLARLSDADKNYAAGTSPYFDVLSSQRDLADAQQALITARGGVSSSLASLKNTIGLDESVPIAITDAGAVEYPPGVPPPPSGPIEGEQTPNQTAPPNGNQEEPMTAPGANFTRLPVPQTSLVKDPFTFGPEYDSALQEAMQTRPEILEAQAQVTAAQKGLLFAAKSILPSVSLSLQYINTPNATGFTLPNNESVTLGISIPLYDGGLARANTQEAKANKATAEVNQRQAADQVQLDVQQAYINLVQARNKVAVTNVEVAQARESFRLARIRYNAGMTEQVSASPQLEIINAQTSLVQAMTDQVNALYDYNNDRAQLDRAIGRYSYSASGPGYKSKPPPSVTTGKG